MSRDIERAVPPLCRELGIGVTAYGVLSRGLLTGSNGEGDGYIRQSSTLVFRVKTWPTIGVLRRHWTKWRRRPASAPRRLQSDGLQARGRTSFRWWGTHSRAPCSGTSFAATAVSGDACRHSGCDPGVCPTRQVNALSAELTIDTARARLSIATRVGTDSTPICGSQYGELA